MTEISPKNGTKILQPVIELLVGIPSVVYGFIDYQSSYHLSETFLAELVLVF